MNPRVSEGGVLSKVTPHALRVYVEAHGWRKVESYGDIGDVYAYGRESPEIVVPMSPHFADYSLRLGQMVTILAHTEEREREAVLRDLSMADFDLVRVRLPESRADGSILLDTAVVMIRQSRNMLLAAACSALRPQPAFEVGKYPRAKSFVSDVRVGQTERGSFVINLLSPALPAFRPRTSDTPTAEPFPRRVMNKLVSGLQATRESVDLGYHRRHDFAVFEYGVDNGVSANLCDAVRGMLNKVSGIDISVNWALTYPRPGEQALVHFHESDIPILKDASQTLKERQDRPNEHVVGYVNSLARQRSDYRGRATIRSLIGDSMSSIRVDFGPENYHNIVDAHGRRRMISVRGDLIRIGRQWTLVNPRDLEILEDPV